VFVLGIPTHLAPRVSAWSMVRAFHAASICSIVVAGAVLVAFGLADRGSGIVPALVALLPTLAMIAVHARIGSWRSAAAFLLVGGVATWWFSLVVQQQLSGTPYVASYLASLAIIPLVLVGGAGTGTARVIAWSVLGFAVGRVASLIGTVQADGMVQPAILAWVTLGLVVGIVGVGTRVTARIQRVQPELLRAAREEHVSAFRQGIEAEAAAILHDTVLNHLNAIALAPSGPIDPELARSVEADFAMLAGQEWLGEERRRVDAAGSPLRDAVDEARAGGLRVVLTGDLGAVDGLDATVATALGRAVAQCLANVAKHAGTDDAEVSVFADRETCTVMVVDDGRGFDESSTGADRMGLRNSVRQRIDRVGGDVQVWSAPGTGTSIMMTVPLRADATSEPVS
jgi:signal transduction histidine kinase